MPARKLRDPEGLGGMAWGISMGSCPILAAFSDVQEKLEVPFCWWRCFFCLPCLWKSKQSMLLLQVGELEGKLGGGLPRAGFYLQCTKESLGTHV